MNILIKKLLSFLVVSVLSFSFLVSFQNCSNQTHFAEVSRDMASSGANFCLNYPTDPLCLPPPPRILSACSFNGQDYPHGGQVPAFQNSSVEYDSQCVEQTRTCEDGSWNGTYSYANCEVGAPRSCLLGDVTIPHGQSVATFQTSTVAFGSSCVSEQRVCNDGQLSGSFSFNSCQVGGPESCLFQDKTIAHGSTVKAYQNLSVSPDGSCVSQNRKCFNGDLDGSYKHGSCAVRSGTCSFNGRDVAHGQKVVAYKTSAVAFGLTCDSQERSCADGSLSGSYEFSSCSVGAEPACTFDNKTVNPGSKVTAYLNSSVKYGEPCTSQERTCGNGQLSGSYSYASCEIDKPKACLFNGETIAHGQFVDAYLKSSVPYDALCRSESNLQRRLCDNGKLSGTFEFKSCEVGVPASCSFNGSQVAHNTNVNAYQNSTVPFGSDCASIKQVRSCVDGKLSGNFQYGSCEPGKPASCKFGEKTLNHGQSDVAYLAAAVPFGQTCSSQPISCNNGKLEGTSYTFTSCAPAAAASCNYRGQAVSHGSNASFFATDSVPYGQSCQSVQRTCHNGGFTGDQNNRFEACSVGPAPCPTSKGILAHGQTESFAKQSTVPFGQTCTYQARTCSAGQLTGSNDFQQASCAVESAKTCSFAGGNIAHGANVTGYKSAQVEFDQDCNAASNISSLSCNNGSLPGSDVFAYSSCTKKPAPLCSLFGRTHTQGSQVAAQLVSNIAWDDARTCASTRITRTCDRGVFTGDASYDKETCVKQTPGNCTLNGVAVAHGTSVTSYNAATVPYNESCDSRRVQNTCTNGQMSHPAYTFTGCKADTPKNCTLNGVPVIHGTSVTSYNTATVPYNESCDSRRVQNTCTNGDMSHPAYTFTGCKADIPKSCTLNGVPVAHGASYTFYAASTPSQGSVCSNTAQVRTCTNGTLNGSASYSQPSCTERSCELDGVVVAHGQSRVFSAARTVAWNASCTNQNRTCFAGNLNGEAAYQFNSCAVSTPKNCTLSDGSIVKHLATRRMYSQAGVEFGRNCDVEVAQDRQCVDGQMQGNASYSHLSCSTAQPLTCTFNGQTVAHGASVNAFAGYSSSWGPDHIMTHNAVSKRNHPHALNECEASLYVNGYKKCTTANPSIDNVCFVSATITSRPSSHFHLWTCSSTMRVAVRGCASESRTCSNGELSGSYTNSSCENTAEPVIDESLLQYETNQETNYQNFIQSF